MMREVQFLTDAVSDLPASWAKEHPEVTVVDTPIIVAKKGCTEVMFHNLTPDTFAEVDAYVQRKYVSRTSLPVIYATPGEVESGVASVERLTKEYLKQGKDVVYLAMNSAISGTYEHVARLYDDINESQQFPSQAVMALDTRCAGTGLAMLIMDLIASKPRCLTDVEIYVLGRRSEIAHVFTWFDFTYIINSGKVNALSGFLGRVLGFHPLCSAEYVDGARPLSTISDRIRGTYKFIDLLSKFVRATIDDEHGVITVAHGNLPDKAAMIAEALREYLPMAKVLQGPDWRCSAAIQAHGGPTSIHVNYHRKRATFDETLKIFHEL